MNYLIRQNGVSFGRVCVVGTGIPIYILAQRLKASETIGEVAADYNMDIGLLRKALIEYIRRYKPKSFIVLSDNYTIQQIDKTNITLSVRQY